MALRLIEIYLPQKFESSCKGLLDEHSIQGAWYEKLLDGQFRAKVLVKADQAEELIDLIEQRFSHEKEFRILLLSVEATIPRPEPDEKTEPVKREFLQEEPEKKSERMCREELYANVEDSANLTKTYLIMVFLSSIVAAVGLVRDNVAIIIGAMVIAPLLGPNMALSLATTLGDAKLTRNSLKSLVVGVLLAATLSVIIGGILTIDPGLTEIKIRTVVGPGDIILATASGSAGALAFTTGLSTTLVGVMVAVALLPPLVVSGLLLGAGHFQLALGAMFVFAANFICVNLSGVVTFLAKGIRPASWWEASKAKKSTRISILIWTLLLALLVLVIYISK